MQLSDASIIMEASAYIKELKQKVVRLNQEIACAQDALRHGSSYPTVCARIHSIRAMSSSPCT